MGASPFLLLTIVLGQTIGVHNAHSLRVPAISHKRCWRLLQDELQIFGFTIRVD